MVAEIVLGVVALASLALNAYLAFTLARILRPVSVRPNVAPRWPQLARSPIAEPSDDALPIAPKPASFADLLQKHGRAEDETGQQWKLG